MVSAHVGIQLDACGPNSTLMTAGVAGHQALGEGFHAIRSGAADFVIAGGSDHGHSLLDLACFVHDDRYTDAKAVESVAISEGAAVLALEDGAHASRRGAEGICEITGFADFTSGSGFHFERAVERSICAVIDQAGWDVAEIDGIVTTLTGKTEIDGRLAEVLESVLGSDSAALPYVEFDSFLGHSLAAAGPIACALMTRRMADDYRLERVLSLALSTSGHACALGLGRHRLTESSRP